MAVLGGRLTLFWGFSTSEATVAVLGGRLALFCGFSASETTVDVTEPDLVEALRFIAITELP